MYVYVMYDENETVLYVGKTKDMKMRMRNILTNYLNDKL